MKDFLKFTGSNMPFIVGSIVIGAICWRTKSASPLWALLLLPKFECTIIHNNQPVEQQA